VQLATVAFEDADAQVELDVRRGEVGGRFQKTARLRDVRGEDAAPIAPVAHRAGPAAQDVGRSQTHQVRALRPVRENKVDVILEAPAHARRVRDDGNAVLPQCFRIADARQHQQQVLQRPGRRITSRFARTLFVAPRCGIRRRGALPSNSTRWRCARRHRQVRTTEMGVRYAAAASAALAVPLRDLVEATLCSAPLKALRR
jgi:hypothetical protein